MGGLVRTMSFESCISQSYKKYYSDYQKGIRKKYIAPWDWKKTDIDIEYEKKEELKNLTENHNKELRKELRTNFNKLLMLSLAPDKSNSFRGFIIEKIKKLLPIIDASHQYLVISESINDILSKHCVNYPKEFVRSESNSIPLGFLG